MSATPIDPNAGTRSAARRGSWTIPLALVAAWMVHVLRNYEIRAYSDPLNWLTFARNFGTEIHASKFALGFPIFLRAALELVGPFRIFLVNLPVLLGLYFLGAGLVTRALGPAARVPRWQILTVTLALFFGYDLWLVVQMMNPFRDPLSFLLALGAAGCLAKHAATGGARPARAAAAGLLLGLASSVRETSVLLLAPFALYAFWSWRANARIRFWRDAWWFAAGFSAGIAPLLFQGWLRTGQAFLPPQSAVENKLVPGAHFTWACMRGTLKNAGPYLLRVAGPGLLLLAGSAALGLWKRNRIIVGLLLPSALVHAVFYAFYWTFVPRYFYSVAVFAIPIAAWGLLLALRRAAAGMPERFRAAAPGAIVGALALGTAAHLLSIRPNEPRFQIPQARQFAADLEPLVPADGLVFSRRHLCEMLQWFTPARAFPATALIPQDIPVEAQLREALAPYLADPQPLLLMEMNPGTGWEVDAALLNRICGLDLVAALPADRYHLVKETGARDFRLFRVVDRPPPPQVLPGIEQAHLGVARLDFALPAVPIATATLAGDFDPPTLARITPRIRTAATVTLPGPIGTGETAYAEFRLCSPTRASDSMSVQVACGATSSSVRLRQDRAWRVFALAVPGPVESPALQFQAATPFDLHWVDWSIPQPGARLDVDLGANDDFPHLRTGWFGREKSPSGTARWTGPVAALTWRCAAPGSPGRITLRHYALNRPAAAPPPRIFCNETELRATAQPDAEPGFATLSAEIPAGLLKAENEIRLESEGWQPGGGDPRTLGIFVDRIRFEAETP